MTIPEDLFAAEFKSLERLFPTLIQKTGLTGNDLWTMQIELVNLQRRWMDSVRESRVSRDPHAVEITRLTDERPEGWTGAVQKEQDALKEIDRRTETYTHLYGLAREFGNALGWRIFGSKLKYILPLTDNQENPPLPSGLALESMLQIASTLNAKDWGFPFLHDVSRSFAIGDISFVRSRTDPITVEIKSHVVAENGNERDVEIKVHAVMSKESAEIVQKMHSGATKREDREVVPGTSKPRHRRQVERMNAAKNDQLRSDGYSKDKHGNRHIVMTLTEKGVDARHWSVAERVLKSAKKHGSACETVDDAILYVGFYSPAGLVRPGTPQVDRSYLDDVPRMLRESGILLKDRSANVIRFGTSVEFLDGKVRPDVTPLFLHRLAPELVIDLARGDLLMLAFTNLGVVKQKLRDAGLDAFALHDPENNENEPMVIVKNVDLPNGQQGRVVQKGLECYFKQMELDYLTVDAFVKMMVSSMNRVSTEVPVAICRDKDDVAMPKGT